MPNTMPNFAEIFATVLPPELAQQDDLATMYKYLRRFYKAKADAKALEFAEQIRKIVLTQRDILSRSGDEVQRENAQKFYNATGELFWRNISSHATKLPEGEKGNFDKQVVAATNAATEKHNALQAEQEAASIYGESLAEVIEIVTAIKERSPDLFIEAVDALRKLNDTESKLSLQYATFLSRYHVYGELRQTFTVFADVVTPNGVELYPDALDELEGLAIKTATDIKAVE